MRAERLSKNTIDQILELITNYPKSREEIIIEVWGNDITATYHQIIKLLNKWYHNGIIKKQKVLAQPKRVKYYRL